MHFRLSSRYTSACPGEGVAPHPSSLVTATGNTLCVLRVASQRRSRHHPGLWMSKSVGTTFRSPASAMGRTDAAIRSAYSTKRANHRPRRQAVHGALHRVSRPWQGWRRHGARAGHAISRHSQPTRRRLSETCCRPSSIPEGKPLAPVTATSDSRPSGLIEAGPKARPRLLRAPMKSGAKNSD